MRERPKSVTLISWTLIVAGETSLVRTILNLHNLGTKETMQQFLLMPIPFFLLVSGIGMLKAQYWARFLYVMWGIIGLVVAFPYWVDLLTQGTIQRKIMLFLPLIFFIVITFSLFSPKANEYFTGTEIQKDS